jgi:hypothetical protein
MGGVAADRSMQDGVVYHENKLIPGAKEMVAWLQKEGKEFLFLTNSSDKTPKDLKYKLSSFGIHVRVALPLLPSSVLRVFELSSRRSHERGGDVGTRLRRRTSTPARSRRPTSSASRSRTARPTSSAMPAFSMRCTTKARGPQTRLCCSCRVASRRASEHG